MKIIYFYLLCVHRDNRFMIDFTALRMGGRFLMQVLLAS